LFEVRCKIASAGNGIQEAVLSGCMCIDSGTAKKIGGFFCIKTLKRADLPSLSFSDNIIQNIGFRL
jgi:hypothetical protein